MSTEKSFADEVISVRISLDEELKRRKEIEAIRREQIALARENEKLAQKSYENCQKGLDLAERLRKLIRS